MRFSRGFGAVACPAGRNHHGTDEMKAMRRLVFCLLLCLMTVVVLAVVSGSAAGVERPTEPGPYRVGYYEDIMDVETYTDWTKVDPNYYSGSKPPGTQYQMPVRIYYPALGTGEGAEPDGSGGPYVFIFFDQDWGESTPNTSAYREEIEFLASHGMVVLTQGERMGPPVGNPVEGIDHARCIVFQIENLTLNSSSVLYGMVNASAMGTVGHHWGGGGSSLHFAFLTNQIKASVCLAPYSSDPLGLYCEYLAERLDNGKVMMQVGLEESGNTDFADRLYSFFEINIKGDGVISKVGLPDADVNGPFRWDLAVSFLFYHLLGEEGYRTFLYGEEATREFAEAEYELEYKIANGRTFPPKAVIEIMEGPIYMERPVIINLSFGGYPQILNSTELRVDWLLNNTPIETPFKVWSVTIELPSPGEYKVSAKWVIGDLKKWTDPFLFSVENEPPVANPGPDRTVTMDQEVIFDGSASRDTRSHIGKLEYMWRFPDGEETGFFNVSTYTRVLTVPGVFEATLTVRDPLGAEDRSLCRITVINEAPTVTAEGPTSGLEDDVLNFTGMGTDTPSDLPSIVYQWEFHDGEVTRWSDSPSTTRVFTQEGTYNATLSVKDRHGVTGSDTVQVTVVNALPEGGIEEPREGYRGLTDTKLSFVGWGRDTPSDHNTLRYTWDFGDAGTAEGAWASHVYNRSGTYEVSLTVEDDDGATNVTRIRLTIQEKGEMGIGGPEAASFTIIIVVILGAVIFATTEPGKYALGLLSAPLFTKTKDVMDNKTRHALLGIIIANPGIHYTALKEELDLANGMAAYHLDVLERESFIQSARDGKLKRFYSAHTKVPDGLNMTPEETREAILRLVHRRPGISQLEVMEELGLDRDAASYYLRELVIEGRLDDTRDGKFTVYRLPGVRRRDT